MCRMDCIRYYLLVLMSNIVWPLVWVNDLIFNKLDVHLVLFVLVVCCLSKDHQFIKLVSVVLLWSHDFISSLLLVFFYVKLWTIWCLILVADFSVARLFINRIKMTDFSVASSDYDCRVIVALVWLLIIYVRSWYVPCRFWKLWVYYSVPD